MDPWCCSNFRKPNSSFWFSNRAGESWEAAWKREWNHRRRRGGARDQAEAGESIQGEYKGDSLQILAEWHLGAIFSNSTIPNISKQICNNKNRRLFGLEADQTNRTFDSPCEFLLSEWGFCSKEKAVPLAMKVNKKNLPRRARFHVPLWVRPWCGWRGPGRPSKLWIK